jgi:hypothetical protein
MGTILKYGLNKVKTKGEPNSQIIGSNFQDIYP